MALILKSNAVASRDLGNIYGLNGPMDFVAVLDFESEQYVVQGQSKKFAEVVNFARDSPAGYTDASGIDRVAAVNEPRFHLVRETGRRGLLLEGSGGNLLLNPEAPATQTVTADRAGSGSAYFTLQVWGTGSATISASDAIAEASGLTATAGNPITICFAATVNQVDLTVTVSGSLERFELQRTLQTAGGSFLPVPLPVGVTSRAAETAELSAAMMSGLLGANEGTVLIGRARKPDLLPGSAYFGQVAYVMDSTRPNGGVYLLQTSKTTVAFDGVEPDATAVAKAFNMPCANISSVTFGASWRDGGAEALLANNGIIIQNDGPLTLSAPDKLVLAGSAPTHANYSSPNSLLTHVVIWNRMLTADELHEATKSWVA